MTRRRNTARNWLQGAAASGIAVCWIAINATTVGAAAKTSEWQPPLMVENPFAAKPTPIATPQETPAPASQSIAGCEVDPEVLPIYRLPRVDAEGLAGERSLLISSRLPHGHDDRGTSVAASAAQKPETGQPLLDGDDIGPISEELPAEMLAQLDHFWTDQFVDEPDYTIHPADALPYSTTVAELSQQLLPSVRKAFGLAQRGALYAAQAEFIQVLRRIALAKDAELGTDAHSQALAAGLRALDEADDFAPQGVQLEAEMNFGVMIASHRTPVLQGRRQTVLPHNAIASYHQYAEQQLGYAVAGERAGSMALHGLGKVYNRVAIESQSDSRHKPKAMTMFLAALAAGPDNHLAANEVGVLLACGGHPAEAAATFRQAIDIAPTSIGYHNLAIVERKLGQHQQAAANERYAAQLAERDRATGAVSRSKGVAWVAPEELARAGPPQPMPPHTASGPPARYGPAAPNSPLAAGAPRSGASTVATWPQKLVPNIFRR